MSVDRLGALGTPRALTALMDLKVQLEETRKAAAKIKRGPAPVITLVTPTLTAPDRLSLTILGSNFQESARVELLDRGEDDDVWPEAGVEAKSYVLSDLDTAENPSFIGRGQIFAVFDVQATGIAATLARSDRMRLEALDELLGLKRQYEARREALRAARFDVRQKQEQIGQLKKEIKDLGRKIESLTAESPKRPERVREMQEKQQELDTLDRDVEELEGQEANLQPEVERLRVLLSAMTFWVVVTNLDGQFDSYPLTIEFA